MNRSLTAVPGLLAGHATNLEGHTGVTAVLFPEGARMGYFQPGSATGSRELGVLDPSHLAPHVHGLCLSGGSAYGLAAADGVMRVLASRKIGFSTDFGVVPIVPAAILFDLHTATRRPDAAMGEAAANAAGTAPLGEGRVGAGTGCRVGSASGTPAPGGFGGWSIPVSAWQVSAGVALNAAGSVLDPATGKILAGGPPQRGPVNAVLGGQTTLVLVATDAPLDKASATVVARMACAGLARTLFPAFTPFDGDLVFVASTKKGEPVGAATVAELGDVAAEAVATAIIRAVAG